MHALQDYQEKLQSYLDGIHQNIDNQQREQLREKLNIDAVMDDIAPLVEGSLEGAERVSEIVQNLRRFSTPQESSKTEFDLVTVVRRATSWVLKATTRKLDVSSDLPDSFRITSNEGYIHQILINLLQNAIDAMENQSDKPQLNIALSGDKNIISIRIHDNGPGIEEQDLVKVFDPFFTTKPVGSGTGLGLYISYGLATEQCQGDLSVRNHPEGGAEFTLTLPNEPV
jgi:two-component system sensor histidine kinase HupT/HoxJ